VAGELYLHVDTVRRLGIVLAGALGAALVATPAGAAALTKPWEVGADIVSSRYDNDSTLSDTFSGGVRGAWQFKPGHHAEMEYTKQSTPSNEHDSDITFDLTKWTVSYLHDFKVKKPDSKMFPLLIFGLGRMWYDNGTDSNGTTLFRGGAGLRLRMNSLIALRFDGTIFHYHGDSQMILPTHGFFGFDLTAGVSFLLGTAK
jgi:hypothetical protein